MKGFIDYGIKSKMVPAYAGDAGIDVRSTMSCTIAPHSCKKIPLGFGIWLDEDEAAYIESRGSFGRIGLLPVSNPIDSNYRGEVNAVMWNITNDPIDVSTGERIAQLVVRKITPPAVHTMYKVSDVPETTRGTQAYGSSGKV